MKLAIPKKNPFSLGYRMPAEWERHEATWLSWPKDPITFPKKIIKEVESTYVKMIENLAGGERVNILVNDKRTKTRVAAMLSTRKNISFHLIKTVDVWMRDYGPIFIKNKKQIAATKWIFNAWGNKYEDLKRDNAAGKKIARLTSFQTFEPDIVLEGGSIDVNGCGTCLTTEQCLLNKNRNPKFNKKQIENYLKTYLGVTNVIWLKDGIAGDDTDGHIDDIAKFVNKDTIICMIEKEKSDENYEALKNNLELLKKAKDQDGKRFNIIPIPMPRGVYSSKNRIPASYANFYIANSYVLVPTFNDRNDKKALSILKRFFPRRKVVGINCEALVYGFGALHCVTQQQPQG